MRQRLLQLEGLLFPGSPGPGGHRIQILVDRLWVKCFLIRYTDFQ